MNPVDPHHLAGRSRYDHPPPPPAQFPDPTPTPYHPHHHHHLHHHAASFPPPPTLPPPAHHPTHHQQQWNDRNRRSEDDRLYRPYPHPPDQFIPPPPPPPPPQLRFQDQLAPPEERYIVGWPPHRSGHDDVFMAEQRWDRHDFAADRFKDVDGRHQLPQLRWEEEETRRFAAFCRDDSYPEDTLEKKRFRWAQGPEFRENSGGLSARGVDYFNGEEIYRKSPVVQAYPSPSSWRVQRSAFLHERDEEVGSFDERRLLPFIPRSSTTHSCNDRYVEGRREEIGPLKEHQIPPISFQISSYADGNMETIDRDTDKAYDNPAEHRYAIGSDYSSQKGHFMNNKGKRRLANGVKDYNEVHSPIPQRQVHSPMKQTPKRLSALSRLQSGKSVWTRIQQKPSDQELEMDELETSLKHNMPLSTIVVPSNSGQPSSYAMDPDVVTPKKRKRSMVQKQGKVVVHIDSGTSFSGMNQGVLKRSVSKTSQNGPATLAKTETFPTKPANGASLPSDLKRMAGTTTMVKTDKRTFRSIICRGEDFSNSDATEKSEKKNFVDTILETSIQKFPLAEKPVSENTADQNTILKGSEGIGHTMENSNSQLTEKDCLHQEIPVSNVVSLNEYTSMSFVQKKSDEIVTAEQVPFDIGLVHNIVNGDDTNNKKIEKKLDCEGCEFLDKSCDTSPNKSSLPKGTSDEFAVQVDCSISNLESGSSIPDTMEHMKEINENQQSEVVTFQEELKTIGNGQDETDCELSHLDANDILINLPPNDRDAILDQHPHVMPMDQKIDTINQQLNVKPPESDYLKLGENLAVFSVHESLVSPPRSDFFNSEVQECLHSADMISSSIKLPNDDAFTDSTFGTIQGEEYGSKISPLLSVRSLELESVEGEKWDKITLSSDSTWDQTRMTESYEPNRGAGIALKTLGSESHLLGKSVLSSNILKELPSHFTRKIVPSTVHLRNRTWHRNSVPSTMSVSNIVLQHPRGDSSSKKSPKKTVRVQSSYVRKGNSLIRKPATEPSHLMSKNGCDASSKLQKHATKGSMRFELKGNSSSNLNCYSRTFERPKTPPLSLGIKTPSVMVNPSINTSHPVSEGAVSVAENNVQVKPLEIISDFGDDKRVTWSKLSEPLNSKRMMYVRHKSNQLVAAHGPKSGNLLTNSFSRAQILPSFAFSDLYYRKNRNQLVRDASSLESQNKQDFIPLNNETMDDKRASTVSSFSRRSSISFMKVLNKVRQKGKKHVAFSHVWTLNEELSQKKVLKLLECRKVLPYFVPWKRMVYWANTFSTLKRRPSLLIGQKLQFLKKKSTTYRSSCDGFSMQKAAGTSLKWSRSSARHSRRANEEAASSVAEVQEIKEEKNSSSACINKKKDHRPCATNEVRVNSLIPRRLIGNHEYIRIGNGNKLVRDPKKLVRILASEKVRWSLHTARLRLARKQQYCQFFTRFGQCNKKDGRCPFIHDSAKIAICTKFLRGACSDDNCKLTHKVIPERMPDCSYFLQGLCTNTSCPYRHVNMNPSALVCEGFLKGYCADGDECRKKHSYDCTQFKATGKCLQGSKCKLHHPKGTTKSKKSKTMEVQGNSWCRYFDYSISETREPLLASRDRRHTGQAEDLCCDDQSSDFISLNIDNDDQYTLTSNVPKDSREEQTMIDQADILQDDLEARIKPIRIMRKDYSVLPALS